MIELKNVSKYYNNNGVVNLGLRNVNLNFDKNEIVAIVGESGSGKSTLLNVICGVDSYDEGEMLFNGYETSYFNQEDMDTYRKQNVSFIYQNYNIIDSYTVLENVMFPLLINGLTKKEAKERALKLIEKVGLKHRANNRGVKLSGGEKQRCVIARALATDCPILACDEPTGNLDSKTGKEIIELIKEVSRDKLVLIVTHNYEQVEGIVTRTIKMSDGEVVSDSNVNTHSLEETKETEIFNDDVKKIKYSTIASIGINNLTSTPKKNIFILMVLFVLSFIGLVLFGNCYSSNVESQLNSYDGYSNIVRERIIVYEKDHKTFDPSIFSDFEYYSNSFYEENDSYYLSLQSKKVYFYEQVNITQHMPYILKNVKGTKEINSSGAFLVLPKLYNYHDDYELDELLTNESTLYTFGGSKLINIVGVATSSEINRALLVCSKELLATVNPYDYSFEYATVYYDDFEASFKINYTNEVSKPRLRVLSNDNEVKSIKLDPSYSKYKICKFTIDAGECEVVTDSIGGYLDLPSFYLEKDCYELSIYSKNVNDVIKIAEANGLNYLIPSKSGASIVSFSFITFVFSVIYSVLIMIFIVFISYTVLQKVYQSRRKDYAIMRSLGMMRPQMAKIIRYEVCVLGFIASILSLLFCLVIVLIVKPIDGPFVYVFTPWFIVLYLIFMFLFDLRLANKFNKKLFKFSVTKTIKEVF